MTTHERNAERIKVDLTLAEARKRREQQQIARIAEEQIDRRSDRLWESGWDDFERHADPRSTRWDR
jgi:hypothetical protein